MRELLAYSQGAVVEEKLALRIRANNSGDIYLPVAGYSIDGTQDCEYDWKVSIDGGEETTYTGIGSSNGAIRVGYGLNPLSVHTVIVKPNVEDFGWLRAFGYKGTSYGSSLINIISDKSYKGYALSDLYSGNYYKAYQYYGCTNLINTDEELLPDTLEIIGDYYRYYEYAGCSKLVSNAEEKILKTVKAIGDNYRAYQYQNCTGLKRVDMRAINWASVGSNYRYNQYSGIGTDRNLVSIYIEGGIEEGGNWGLNNNNIKGVYVFKDLVSDYQTKLSNITSSKIQKNAIWDNYEYEFIEFIALADSTGNIRIPIGGFSTTMSQDCAYDWMVSVDGGEAVEITGTGDDSFVSVGSGLTEGSEHRVIIKPKTIGWGWGRAFGYYSTGAEPYIKELIHDSYKCYAVSRIDTGAHYKHATYTGCINLINSYEKLPTSVTTIGNHYMKECYAGCTSLTTAFWEVMHKGVTMGADYRKTEYAGCTSMELHQGIAGGDFASLPSGYREGYLGGAGNNLDIYITRKLELFVVSTTFSSNNKYSVTKAGKYVASGTFNSTSNQGTTYGYFTKTHNGADTNFAFVESSERTSFAIYGTTNAEVGDLIFYRTETPGYGGGYIGGAKLIYGENLSLTENNIHKVYAYVDDLYDLNVAAGISQSKLAVYYYGYKCYEMKDINRYTKLLAQVTVPVNWDALLREFDRGFAINRKMTEVAIAGTQYGKDQKSNNYVGPIFYTPTWTISGKDKILSGLTYKTLNSWGGSNWSGGNISYSGGYAYSKNGTLYGHYAYNGSNYDYAGEEGIGQDVRAGSQSTAGEISRNGQYLWGFWGGGKKWLCSSKNVWDSSSVVVGGNSVSYNLKFSDDGMTVVMGSGTLIQYTLTYPRELSGAVSTGKTLNMSGLICFSYDFKYLFKFDVDAGKVYQYTYE